MLEPHNDVIPTNRSTPQLVCEVTPNFLQQILPINRHPSLPSILSNIHLPSLAFRLAASSTPTLAPKFGSKKNGTETL